MTILLLRHAEAEQNAASDSDRCLTAKGISQAERTGEFCLRHGIKPEIILSSPVRRARQTAEIVARALDNTELLVAPWAACGMSPAVAAVELKACAKFSSVLLVGHQPDLGCLAGSLLGSGDAPLHVRKSLLCAIETSRDLRRGVLEFFIPVKLMG